MSDKEIEIAIKTTADTKGAEAVEASIEAMDEARKKAAAESIKNGDDEAKAARRLEYELKKVEAATTGIATVESRGFDGMLDAEKIEKTAEAHGKLNEELREEAGAVGAVEAAAVKAGNELDVLEAKRRKAAREAAAEKSKGGLLGVDLTGGIDAAAEAAAGAAGFGGGFRAIKGALGADAAAVAGSFAAIGLAAVESYKLLSGTVKGYKDLMQEAAAQGTSLGSDVEIQVKALEDTLAPLTGVIDFVAERWEALVETVTNPIDSFSGLGDLKRSIDAAKDQMDKLNALRLKIATENQGDLKSVYDGELEKLKEQEQSLQRISRLRAELSGQENRAASLEIESTRLRGGDVALAEANALATQLRTGLDGLGEKLRASQATATASTREYDSALVTYQQAIRDGLNKLEPAKFEQISKGVDTAKQALDAANQAITDQQQIYQTSKNNLIQSTENNLAKLEQEYDGKTSAAATKAFDGIYQNLQTAFSEGPKPALEAIKVNTAAFTEATSSKATEVATGIDQLQAGAVKQADVLLGKTGQANENIATAATRLDTGISTLSGNVDKLLGIGRDLASIAGRQAEQISTLKQQVQALHRR